MKLAILSALFLPVISFSQIANEVKEIEKQLVFDEHSIYLFCRGTKAKQGLIARQFNIKDSLATHIGIGIFRDNKLRIYNVVDRRGNAFQIDSLTSFITSEVFYLGIWHCELTMDECLRTDSLLKDYSSKKIAFDFQFNFRDDDTLYCSEFTYHFLHKVNQIKFNFSLSEKVLANQFHKLYLKREKLIYLPIDFFQTGKAFVKMYEKNL